MWHFSGVWERGIGRPQIVALQGEANGVDSKKNGLEVVQWAPHGRSSNLPHLKGSKLQGVLGRSIY